MIRENNKTAARKLFLNAMYLKELSKLNCVILKDVVPQRNLYKIYLIFCAKIYEIFIAILQKKRNKSDNKYLYRKIT